MRNVQLTPQLVQAVRDAVDIVAIASEHTKLRRNGRRHVGLCPLHKEKTPSFSVDGEQGLFYCFGCGSGGDAIKLHMLLSGDDFSAAIESLALRYGIPLPAPGREKKGGRAAPELDRVLEAAEDFFMRALERSPSAKGYLERRQIPAELARRFKLGLAPPGWRNLVEALGPHFKLTELEAAGLVGRSERRGGEPYDRFRNRLIFPIRNASGRLVGFGGRTLEDDKAKYINSAETDRFHKGMLLYGLDLARRRAREAGRILLVEGYFDVIAAAASGVEEVVASMGTSLTGDQSRLLARYAEEVIVGYDSDQAGEQAYRRALPELLAQGLNVRRARFGEGHDPDSLRLARGVEAVRRAIDEGSDAVADEIHRLTPPDVHRSPRRRADAAKAVADLLKPIPDSVLRYTYGRDAADRIGVPVELLWKRLAIDSRSLAKEEGAPASERKLVRSLEERALELLLDPRQPALVPEAMPPEEVFLDPAARNIFRVVNALYTAAEGFPEPKAVVAGLKGERDAVDLLARILLEGRFAPAEGELVGVLSHLRRRWMQTRLREIGTQIREVARGSDDERLERLLEEKERLSRSLHHLGES
ncbi:MAG TPA: DNA primase [Thermoanaerobaculia bacterium]|nr:DNA primase [Thermoanaerobaculia bacterium]